MHALLGLLSIEPMSGYDLGQAIRASIGHIWSESYGQIYPNLKTLASEGLISAKIEKKRGKPDRTVYSITGAGRDLLASWLLTAPQAEVPRNELLLKLFFGARTSPAVLIGYVENMASQESAVLRKLEQVQAEIDQNEQLYPDTPYWKMTARFGQFELEAHVRWAEETLGQLRKLSQPQSTLETSVTPAISGDAK